MRNDSNVPPGWITAAGPIGGRGVSKMADASQIAALRSRTVGSDWILEGALTAAGRTVPAGNYTMFFTLHESGTWVLNLKDKAKEDAAPIRWGLRLAETQGKHTRMHLALAPAAKAGECTLTIAFGSMSVTVPVTPAKADGEGN